LLQLFEAPGHSKHKTNRQRNAHKPNQGHKDHFAAQFVEGDKKGLLGNLYIGGLNPDKD